MKERLDVLVQWARDHRFWIALPVATLVPVLVAVWVGTGALERAEAWRSRAAELKATRDVASAWRSELLAPTPAESAAWRESARSVRRRGIAGSDRIAIMQTVAERAESLGLVGVTVSFVSADTMPAGPPREVGGDVFELAPYGLEARFSGDYGGVASFLGSLPPPVEVFGLEVERADPGVMARVTLVVYLGGGGADAAAP